jgi:hypothetical protein
VDQKNKRSETRRMKSVSLLLSSAILVLILLAAGCDEDPVSVGVGILPNEDFVEIDTVVVEAMSSYSFEMPLGTGGTSTLFIGEDSDVRVVSLFRIDSLLTSRGITPDSIESSTFFEAKLLFHPTYFYGDSNQTIGIDAYEILSGWASQTFTREHIETIRFGSDIVGSSLPVTLADTNDIEITLSDDLMLRWSRMGERGIVPQGLLLTPAAGTDGIIGVSGSAATVVPRLRLVTGSVEDPDTTIFTVNSRAYAAYLKQDLNLVETLVIQAGTSTRSIVKFDLSSIPKGSLIHNARLELTRNNELSRSQEGARADSLLALQLVDENKGITTDVYRAFFSRTLTDSLQETVTYSASVGNIVQGWVIDIENRGFLLRDDLETLGFHRTSFHTEREDDAAIRPRLTVVFSPF